MKFRYKSITFFITLAIIILVCAYSYNGKSSISEKTKVSSNNNINDAMEAKMSANRNSDNYYSAETSYPIVGTSGSIIKTYDSVKSLYKNSDIVALVKVKNQNVFMYSDTGVATSSQVDIKKIFKGDTKLKSLTITELGGPVDLSKLPKVNKPGDEKAKAEGIVEVAFEGSVVMKENNTYYVFLVKNNNEKFGYNILGAVQGKIKVDENSNKMLATVSKEMLQEGNLFILQKEFAGKDMEDIETQLK